MIDNYLAIATPQRTHLITELTKSLAEKTKVRRYDRCGLSAKVFSLSRVI